jgi:hypothetical protein
VQLLRSVCPSMMYNDPRFFLLLKIQRIWPNPHPSHAVSRVLVVCGIAKELRAHLPAHPQPPTGCTDGYWAWGVGAATPETQYYSPWPAGTGRQADAPMWCDRNTAIRAGKRAMPCQKVPDSRCRGAILRDVKIGSSNNLQFPQLFLHHEGCTVDASDCRLLG